MCNINDAYDMKLFTNDSMYDDAGWENEQQQIASPRAFTRAVESSMPTSQNPKNIFSTQGDFDTYSKTLQNYPTGYPGAPIDLQVRNETQPLKFDPDNIQELLREPIQTPYDETMQVTTRPHKIVQKKVTPQQESVIPIEIETKELTSQSTCPMSKKNKHDKQYSGQNKLMISFTTGLRETIFILIIGIIIIFLLDILVRIGKKL